MLTTYPDIYAAQRHHVQAVEPPSRYIMSPPFTHSHISNDRLSAEHILACSYSIQ